MRVSRAQPASDTFINPTWLQWSSSNQQDASTPVWIVKDQVRAARTNQDKEGEGCPTSNRCNIINCIERTISIKLPHSENPSYKSKWKNTCVDTPGVTGFCMWLPARPTSLQNQSHTHTHTPYQSSLSHVSPLQPQATHYISVYVYHPNKYKKISFMGEAVIHCSPGSWREASLTHGLL